MLAKRDASRTALRDALDAVDGFEQGAIAQALAREAAVGEDSTDAETGGGALQLDARLAQASRRLEAAEEEVDGQLKAMGAFAGTVRGAMVSAAERREKAQRTLEALAMEQRKASEEMRLSLESALGSMAQMQSEWDAAVAANAAELRSLKADANSAEGDNEQRLSALRRLRDELRSRSSGLSELNKQRQSLEQAEAKLRQRAQTLRERRDAKLAGGRLPVDLPYDFEDAAEKAAAGAEKAATELLRLFGSSRQRDKRADDTPPKA